MDFNQQILRAVIFDLDGTLIDTALDVRLALNHMLQTFGQPPITRERIYSLIGKGARVMIKSAFANNGYLASESEIDEGLNCYLNYYRAHPVVETKIYPGVFDVLTKLDGDGWQLGICTNKPSMMVDIVLDILDLRRFFVAVVAGDSVMHPKPHRHHIDVVLDKMATPHVQAVFVGDSEVDEASARNALIPFIGVSFGYANDTLTPDKMIHHFNELPAALHQMSKEGAHVL